MPTTPVAVPPRMLAAIPAHRHFPPEAAMPLLLGELVPDDVERVLFLGDDPWSAQTLEWTTTSPAPIDNYNEVPTVMSPEPALDRRGPDGADR